jgi:hypothetical protein
MFSAVARRSLIPRSNIALKLATKQQQQHVTRAAVTSFSSLTPSSSNHKSDKQQQQQQQQQQHRHVHSTPSRKSEATTPTTAAPTTETSTTSSSSGGLMSRFVVTAEVTVSKIFPAGFGWQSSSILAENHLGYAADTMSFALTTGAGDALGVLLGHVSFYASKKALGFDSTINMSKEVHTGILLGSAAFCSGTAWQPLVDALQGANLSFSSVFVGTWVGCGTAFYAGLRGGRSILSGYLQHIEEPTYENSKTDLQLSTVIGGATGFFVGTDAAYLPDQNFLIDIVGIADGTPDLTGCVIAGSSTAMGFAASQTGMNMIFPAGKCWND